MPFPGELALCVGVENLSAQFITAGGMPLVDVAMPTDTIDMHVLHNTGLVYEYTG